MMKPSGTGKEGRKEKQLSDSGEPIPALIRRLKAGEIATTGLSKESRGACVEHLTAEGRPTTEVAELLGVAARTVRRDLQEIRTSYAVHRTPAAIDEVVGRVVRQAEIADNGIRRAAQLEDAKSSDRIRAELACWRVNRELVEVLQRLGRLPSAPRNDPNYMQDNVASLIAAKRALAEAREKRLVELGLPPGTTMATKQKLLAVIDEYVAQEE